MQTKCRLEADERPIDSCPASMGQAIITKFGLPLASRYPNLNNNCGGAHEATSPIPTWVTGLSAVLRFTSADLALTAGSG